MILIALFCEELCSVAETDTTSALRLDNRSCQGQRQNTGPTPGMSIMMFSYCISGSNVALIVITIPQDILFCLQLLVKIRDARLEQLN